MTLSRSQILTMNPQIRFLRMAETHGLDPAKCWEWQSALNGNGYGRFSFKNKHVLAHRYSYESFVGPIPDGLNVCHKCDNRLCVNPDHLWIGTQSENLKDAFAKGRHSAPNLPPEANGNGKLTADEVRAIRAKRECGASLATIAAEYCVSLSTISGISNRKTWKDQRYG